MNKLLVFSRKFSVDFVISFLIVVSLSSFILYFLQDLHLPYADAISRLNISRKVVDNLTPGLPQIGNVWLPLPQLFMVPAIWNNYLWHSGIAGYLMSGTSFVICGLFIYKSALLVTKSYLAGIFACFIFALNINILYLQTTAMSESIFLASLSSSIYFFLKWFHTREKSALIWAGISVGAMTLIRYESLAFLIPSIPLVFFYSYISNKNIHKAEGNTIMYAVVACLGFALWTLYLAVIFGNPLYWRDYYATPQATGGAEVIFTQAKPFVAAVIQYFTSFVWMIGIVPVILGSIGVVIMLFYSWYKKTWDFLVLLMPFSIFLFMVLTLQRNTPVVQPDLSFTNFLSPETSYQTGFNIRYGLLLLPIVAIFCSYLLIFKRLYVKIPIFIIVLALFSVQIYTYFNRSFSVIYQIPARIQEKPFGRSVNWIKENYDGGKILISAGSQEDQMFATGFNYSTFIHEGTGKYWKESVDNPSRYAKWVIIDYGHSSDNVAKQMNREDILQREYEQVYQENQLIIYKKIKDPYYKIE